MNLLFISNDSYINDSLVNKLTPIGINIIRFEKVSEAIVQLNKIDPYVIIIDTDSESRAWKPFASMVKNTPGEIALTVILFLPNSNAHNLVNANKPALLTL